MIINIDQKFDSLLVSYINREGNVDLLKLNIPPQQKYIYSYARGGDRESKLLSWDGKPVKKIGTEFLSKSRIQEFLIDAGPEITNKLFEPNMPKLASVDIETDVTDEGFADPGVANNRINTIALCRFPDVIVFGLKELSGDDCKRIENDINEHIKKSGKKYRFLYKYYENEANMLYDFLYNYVRKLPLIVGWNFWLFDWRYILNRCKLLNMDISWIAPGHQWKQYRFEDRNEKVPVMLPKHKLVVDYMAVYKKWDRKIDIKENNTLDFVAESALGIQKVKYPGTFQELYNKDYDKHVFYNAVDSILVELIHYELKTVDTFLGLANVAGVEAMDAFSPIAMFESSLVRCAYKRGQVFPKIKHDNKREEYEGAFVFRPKPGLYGLVGSYDFKGLYPSIMRQWKISIENFKGKDKQRQPNQYETKCVTGAIFDTSTTPLVTELLNDYTSQRYSAKKIYQETEKEASQLKEILKARKLQSQSAIE